MTLEMDNDLLTEIHKATRQDKDAQPWRVDIDWGAYDKPITKSSMLGRIYGILLDDKP